MRLALILIGLLTVQFISAQNLEDGLLLHYPMSGNADDISGNGYDGDVNATLSQDRFGNPNEAYHFNGVNEYIDFPNVDELKPPLPLTISFWIKYDDTPNTDRAVFNTSLEEDVNSGVMFTSEESTGKYAIGFGDGDPGYTSASIRKYVSNTIIDMQEWHHITLVLTSATDMKIYVDCVESGGTYGGSGGPMEYSPMPGTIGRHDQTVGVPAYYFEGYIDDFRYWNRALTNEEIDLVCYAEPIVYDCPELNMHIGNSCDDGNDLSQNDVITEDCTCQGVIFYDCPFEEAFFGDSCDDGNPETVNDIITEACECLGEIVYDCDILELNFGDLCDDGDYFTINDIVNEDCNCIGTNTSATFGGLLDWPIACDPRIMTVEFYEAGTNIGVAIYYALLNSDGSFELVSAPVGNYDIYIKVQGALQILVENQTILDDENFLDVGQIVLGDLNGDNGINIGDVSEINVSFGSTIGESNYDPISDLNCDGAINIIDLSILNAGFGLTGDAP